MKRIKCTIAAILTGMLIFSCFPSEINFGISANKNNSVKKSEQLSHCNGDDHHSHNPLCEHNDVKIAIFDSGINNVKTEGSISFVEEEKVSDHGNSLAHNLADTVHHIKLYDVRILDNNNEGKYSSLSKGVDWAIENDIDIISLSVVGFESSEILESAINKAEENNILIVAAAGNESNDKPTYPASYPWVISVGALDENSKIASYSNYGDFVDIYKSASLEGTSYATISAVACAANMMVSNPDLTAKEIRKILVGNKIKSNSYTNNHTDGKLVAAACSHVFNGSYTTTKAAKCTTTGTKVGKCSKCGAVIVTLTIPALGHSYGAWTTTIQATCTTNGFKMRKCSRCGTAQTQTITATGHTFNGGYTITKAATCTATGTKVGKCSKCGAVVSTVTIPKLGHSYGAWTTTIQATCTTNGFKMRKCTLCGAVETQTITAIGHTFNGGYTITKAATCISTGTKVGKCEKCGAIVATVSISKLGDSGHKLTGEYTVIKEPTCIEPGLKAQICTICEAQVNKLTIPPLGIDSEKGHNYTYLRTKAPTSDRTGLEVGRCMCGNTVTRLVPKVLEAEYTYKLKKADAYSKYGYVEFNGVKYSIMVESGPVISVPLTTIAYVYNEDRNFSFDGFISGFSLTSDYTDFADAGAPRSGAVVLFIDLLSQIADNIKTSYYYMSINESSDGTVREARIYIGNSDYKKAIEELGVGHEISLYDRTKMNGGNTVGVEIIASGLYESETGKEADSGLLDTYDLILSLDPARANNVYTENLYMNSAGELVRHMIPFRNDKLYIAKRNPWTLNIAYTKVLDISYLLQDTTQN